MHFDSRIARYLSLVRALFILTAPVSTVFVAGVSCAALVSIAATAAGVFRVPPALILLFGVLLIRELRRAPRLEAEVRRYSRISRFVVFALVSIAGWWAIRPLLQLRVAETWTAGQGGLDVLAAGIAIALTLSTTRAGAILTTQLVVEQIRRNRRLHILLLHSFRADLSADVDRCVVPIFRAFGVVKRLRNPAHDGAVPKQIFGVPVKALASFDVTPARPDDWMREVEVLMRQADVVVFDETETSPNLDDELALAHAMGLGDRICFIRSATASTGRRDVLIYGSGLRKLSFSAEVTAWMASSSRNLRR
jgi:hypothetical protein